jgi:hypothetical protein
MGTVPSLDFFDADIDARHRADERDDRDQHACPPREGPFPKAKPRTGVAALSAEPVAGLTRHFGTACWSPVRPQISAPKERKTGAQVEGGRRVSFKSPSPRAAGPKRSR